MENKEEKPKIPKIPKIPKVKLAHEFKEFLKEYKVMSLAIAFIMALAANTLVKALVDDIVMPIITPFIPGGGWETATFTVWKFIIAWGPFLSALIYFLIIALVIFFVAKFLMKEDKVTKK